MYTLVLSDLHLGAGGSGNPLEDLWHDEALLNLLDDVARSSEAPRRTVDVVLNGDTFDFWQVPALAFAAPV